MKTIQRLLPVYSEKDLKAMKDTPFYLSGPFRLGQSPKVKLWKMTRQYYSVVGNQSCHPTYSVKGLKDRII